MSFKKSLGIIAVTSALVLAMTAATPSLAARTDSGKSVVAASDDRGTRADAPKLAWLGGEVGTMRSGR